MKIWLVLLYAVVGLQLGACAGSGFVFADAMANKDWRWATEFFVLGMFNLLAALNTWPLIQYVHHRRRRTWIMRPGGRPTIVPESALPRTTMIIPMPQAKTVPPATTAAGARAGE